MTRRRSYQQNCALAIALDIIGERWTLLIIREVMIRPRRFKDLQENLPGIGSNLLSGRLQQLVSDGILQRRGDGHPLYTLGAAGKNLVPVIHGLIRWGMSFNGYREDSNYSSPDWLILVLQAFFRADIGRQWRGAYQLCIGVQSLVLACEDDCLVTKDEDSKAICRIAFSAETAGKLAAADLSLHAGLQSGEIETEGERTDISRFFQAFGNE